MRHGPYLFLGLLFALSLSWLGMIATPQLQIGDQQPTQVPPTNVLYPTPPPGLASLGREVYRANGCAYCHTQVVRQHGAEFDVVLTDAGTNQPAVVKALLQFRQDLSDADAQQLIASIPGAVATTPTKIAADALLAALVAEEAEGTVRVVPTGPEIARGWGHRLTVGADYLYDRPLMLGSIRIGPDLTNIGLRRPDELWHLIHLYDPKLKVQGSIMPRYPFLFEKLPPGRRSAEALAIPGDQAVVPTREARALVAYLLSLKAEMPLFEAPGPPQPAAPPGAAQETNQPPATAENAIVPPGAAELPSPANNPLTAP